MFSSKTVAAPRCSVWISGRPLAVGVVKMVKFALLALAALASSAVAAPTTSSGTCALHCTDPHSFAYQTGKSYVYDYSVDTMTALVGVSGDAAKIGIKAKAHIDVVAPCEYVLKVTDVNLEDSSHAGEFAEAVSKYPLKFSFQDGMIENVCSDVSEPTWVLNLKRGLLSTFQNTMSYHGDENLQEKDVSGVCETHYKAVTEGDTITVEKITDLTSCSERPDFSTMISSSSYKTDSHIQNLPILKTTNECHQKIQNDILVSAECEESYKSRPFQNERGTARTIVKTSLVLLSQESLQYIPEFQFYRQSMVFDDEHLETPAAQIAKVEQLLSDLTVSTQDEIHRETPALFSKLIEALKGLNYQQLSQIYSSTSEPHAHKFLIDAMPLVGTAASSVLVKDMIVKNEMTSVESDIWFTSLFFYKNPSVEMLNAIALLLESNPSQKALLGTSAVINNYCKSHSTCESEPIVKKVIQLLENQLGSGCRVTNDEEKVKVIVAIKALGNAGHWRNAKSILETCYSEENDMEIRVAALDAWRHVPCEYNHESIVRVLQNEALDPELRIAAYLSSMSCPTPSFIDMVKEKLVSEGVNQVGSFIWTHMTNLQESAAPEKQMWQDIIGEEFLQKKYRTDALQFSRNYESSFFMNELNIGGSAESNVIFNSKSYLPRSAMLNLTLDLFGESINFLEVGGRIEGFEAYIERFFGSNGYFPEEHVAQALKNMRSKSNADSTTLEGILEKMTEEPQGSYYVRVFDKELHYRHFNGIENIISGDTSNLMEFLMDLFRQGNIDYTKSFQITETHQYIPTISGLPIILDSEITGTFGMQMNGNFKANGLTDFNIEGHIHPSVALEVEGHMVIDAHATKAGVKLATTLHSSTFLDGKMQVNNGKLVDIEINTPKEKVEVLDVKGEYLYVVDDQEVKKDIPYETEFEGCTSGDIGVAVCGLAKNVPGILSPFEGALYLKKTGTQTGYALHFKQESENFEFMIDAPGSQTDHKISLKLTNGDGIITGDLHTPFMSGKGNLEYLWTNLNKKLKVAMTIDGSDQYELETSLLKSADEVPLYETFLKLRLPVGEILDIHGKMKNKLDYYDTSISTNMEVAYKWGSQQTVNLELEATKKLTDSMSTYSLHGSIDPSQFADFKSSIELTFTETEYQHYKVQAKGILKGDTYMVEGKLENNSVRGKFNVMADGSLTVPGHEFKTELNIYADSEKVSSHIEATVDGQKYDFNLKGTKSSVVIDANIIRHIVLNAKIDSSEEEQKLQIIGEWNKDVDPKAVFKIEGHISKVEAGMSYEFMESHGSVTGKLLSNGVDLKVMWEGKELSVGARYTLGETKSLAISVETPFQRLEKQDAKISVLLKDFEINSQISATWQNTQQFGFDIIGKLEPGISHNSLHTEVKFSSTFPKFELITFKVDHEMKDASINTEMVDHWDAWDVKAIFHNVPTSDGLQSSLSFESPFTQKAIITLNHALKSKDLTSIIEAKYGSQIVTANLKGHLDLSDIHDVALVLKINVPSPNVPEITANIHYKFNWAHLEFAFEGVIGQKKIMLNANGELTTGDSTNLTGNLRLITPFMYPVTASIYHKNGNQEFESKFEITRFWSDYGNLKMHALGHMIYPEDIDFSVQIFTPTNKVSASLDHKVTETHMTSKFDVYFNEYELTVKVNGLLDMSKSLANLEAEMRSTINGLNDIKINIESLKNDIKRVSKIILLKNEQSLTIDHIISFKDIFNWENTFNINGKYQIKNLQTHIDTLYTHDIKYSWYSQNVHLTSSLENKSSGNFHDINAITSLITPWTETMKLEVHHQDDGVEYKPVIIIGYVPGRKIELSNNFVFGTVSSFESTLTTPFTDPLGYKVTLDIMSPRKALSALLNWGEREVSIDINGKWEKRTLEGNLEVKSIYLRTPFKAEASYDFVAPQKKIHLLFDFVEKLEITGLLSGNVNQGEWSFVVEMPTTTAKHTELSGKWHYNITSAEIKVHSSVTSFENSEFHMKYDIQNEKKVEVKLTYGSKSIQLIGKKEGETFVLDVSTPFGNWERMKLSVFLSETAIDAFVSKNDETISVKGTMHVKMEKGTLNLSIKTPFANYEAISADLTYLLRGPLKQIKFNSSFAAGEISCNGVIDLSKDLSPNMKLDITTPFTIMSRIGGEAHFDMSHSLKTADVKAYRNDRQYHWQLETSSESLSKARIKSKITTPIAEWTNVGVEGDFDITRMPYMFKFVLDKEAMKNTIEGTIDIQDNTLNCQVMTPIPGLESISLTGNYNWQDNHFSGNFEVIKSSDKYELVTDVLLKTQTPEIHLTLKTPIASFNNIEFKFESNLVDEQKKSLVMFQLNDKVYSLNFEGQMISKTGQVHVLAQSPIPGFTTVDVSAKYDFAHDVKIAELDFKIEDDSKHFYLKTQVQDNNFHIELHTPFKGFELVKMIGDYTAEHDKHTVLASFEKDHHRYDYNADVTLDDYKFSLALSTPIEVMKNIELSVEYELFKNGVEGLVHFERNGEKYEVKTRGIFTPLKSELLVNLITPIADWKKLTLDFEYDILSEKKSASIFIQKGNLKKKVTIEGQYSPKVGSFKIKVPVAGFEVLGASYTLDIDLSNKKAETNVKVFKNSQEWSFMAKGQYSNSMIMIHFQTPFEEFKSISVEGNIDFSKKMGELDLEMGSYKFTTQLSYAANNMLFKLITPFDAVKIASVGFKYEWTASKKDATLDITYNENNYAVSGILKLSVHALEVTLKATTPFPGFSNTNVSVKYDIDNKDELISSKMTSDQYEYSFKVGGSFESTEAHLICDLTSSFPGWNHAQFNANAIWGGDQKTFEVSLGKEENMNAITLSTSIKGFSEGSLIIHTPFEGMEDMGGKFVLTVGEKLQGELDLVLPSYLIPKIHLDIDLDLAGKIKGDINLNIAGEVYTVKSNLVGNSFEEGYNGALEIYTPIHALSKVILEGNFMLKRWTSLQTHLKAEIPSGLYEIDLKSNFALGDSSFKFGVETKIMNIVRKVIFEAKYPSLNNIEGTVVAVLDDQTHKIHGKFNINSNHVQGTLDLESALIQGPRQISFDVSFPTSSYQHVILDLTFASASSHSLHLDLDVTKGVQLSFQVKSPAFPQVSVTFKLMAASAGLAITTPEGVHEIKMSWRMTYKMPADYLASFEVASPLLSKTYGINVLLNGGMDDMNFKAELMTGSTRHVIEGSTSMAQSSGNVSFNVESPLFNINKATLSASLKFASTVEMHITATYSDKVNTFDLVYEKASRAFHVEISSPFIPTGLARGEGQVTGEMENMQIKMTLKNNAKTLSGTMNVHVLSQDNMKVNLLVITPYKGYKKMKFGAQYLKDEDTKIIFFIDRPVKFNTELRLRNTEKEVKVFFKVETPIEQFQKIEGEIKIPLTLFAPKLAADVMIGGFYYGGHLTLRTTPPYELGAGYTIADKYTGNFHIRTDSSFFYLFV